MLAFLFKKDVENECESLNSFYSKIKSLYSFNYISEERKEYLKSQMERFGYLPYPHIKALEELSDSEVLYALEYKWSANGVFENGKFDYKYAVKIINFYKKNNYSLSSIKNYCYLYIIKVLLEKLYYSHLYDLNLESNSQKKDYWLWWYNLLKEIELIDMK